MNDASDATTNTAKCAPPRGERFARERHSFTHVHGRRRTPRTGRPVGLALWALALSMAAGGGCAISHELVDVRRRDASAADAAPADAAAEPDAVVLDAPASADAPRDTRVLDAGPPCPVADYVARLSESWCVMLERCGLVEMYAARYYGGEIVDCVAQLSVEFASRYGVLLCDAVASGTTTPSAAEMDACMESYSSFVCGHEESWFYQDPSCDRALAGTLADGSECTLDAECLVTSDCRLVTPVVDTCPYGFCEHVPQLGEPCGLGTGRCASGTWCSSSTCVARVPVGERCDRFLGTRECAHGLFCHDDPSSDDDRVGVCGPWQPGRIGDACGWPSDECDVGLVCPSGIGPARCRAPRRDGTCESDYYLYRLTADCPSGSGCEYDAAGLGHCRPSPTLGETCREGGQACAAPYRCVADRCVVSLANGEACTTDDVCLGGACRAGRCAARPLCAP